jgi:hypothetical protein
MTVPRFEAAEGAGLSFSQIAKPAMLRFLNSAVVAV